MIRRFAASEREIINKNNSLIGRSKKVNTTQSKLTNVHAWVIGFALLSLIMPVAAGILRQEPAVPFSDPAHVSYYRQTVAALILGLVSAVAAFVGNRTLRPAWFHRLSLLLVSLGVLLSLYLLSTLIGSCGAQVITGMCNP